MYSVTEVLDHYGIEYKPSPEAGEVLFLCPFHDDINFGSASFNTAEVVFCCFSCGEGGNLQQFVAKMEGSTVQQASKLIDNDFVVGEQYGVSSAYDNAYRHDDEPKIPDALVKQRVQRFTYTILEKLDMKDTAYAAYWIAVCCWANSPGVMVTKSFLDHLLKIHKEFMEESKKAKKG